MINEIKRMNEEKRGQSAIPLLLGTIAVGAVGAVIIGMILAQVIPIQGVYNGNTSFASIRDNMIPLFALAIVGGAIVGALLYGFLAFIGGGKGV